MLANLHWAAVTPEVRWVEVPWLSEGGSFPCGMPMPELVDGRMQLPAGPGLGFSPKSAKPT